MVLELEEPELVTLDEFTVAGLAHRGPPEDDFGGLWEQFSGHADELAEISASNESYGVIYEYEQGGDEFTYLAGIAVEDTNDLAPELTVVEIPEQTYAIFPEQEAAVGDIVEGIHDDGFSDYEYNRVEGPAFERYTEDYDPALSDAGFELFVPVDAAEADYAGYDEYDTEDEY